MSGPSSRNKQRRPSHNTSRRTSLACDRCRGRKTKCAGISPQACSACEDAGVECTYTESEKRVPVLESELLELKARAELANEFMKSRQNSDVSSFTIEDDTAREDDAWWYKGMNTLFLTQSGERRFVGTASSTYLAQKLSPSPGNNLSWDVHPMYKDPSSLRRPKSPVPPQLPPYEFARRLFAAQYIYIGTIFSFLQPHTFEARLQQIYSRAPNLENREECLAYCQILLIFAYGQMYSVNQWSGTDGPPGFSYFKHALWLLPDIHQEGSILFVEVLGLLAPYLQNLNRRDAAFLYIGLAVRMAISLGLHQEVDESGMDMVEREHRRRVWWSVYSMDRILSVKSGNPISIHDEDIDVALPAPIPGVDPDLSPPRVLAHYTQLSRILGRIGESIYRKKSRSGTSLLASVQSIMNDLSEWLKHVPSELQIDFTALNGPLSREAVSTFLHYYQCINMTARPLLLYVIQSRLEALANGTAPVSWKDGLSANVVAVIDNTIAAARASSMIMSAAARQNIFATYGFMDGEHAFSASLILVMVNVAFPYNERDEKAMEAALFVLQSMAEKGNEYIQARLSLLLNLRASIGPRASTYRNQLQTPVGLPDHQLGEPNLGLQYASFPFVSQITLPDTSPQLDVHFQPLQDVALDLETEDDPTFWEEIRKNINMDIDSTVWIEDTLRNEAYYLQHNM